jgi:hypothetical protein
MPSTISAGTTAGTALNFVSDTTGNLAFQTNGSTTAMTIDTSQNVTFANNVTYSGNITGSTVTATAAFSGNGAAISAINASNVASGTLAVARGGTGLTTLTANNVLIGNGTSNVAFVAPGSNGNVLTSNGTVWTSAAATQKIINVETVTNSTRSSLSLTVSPLTLVNFTYNKQSTSSSLIFIVMIPLYGNYSSACACDLTYGTSSAFGSLAFTYTGQAGPMPMMGQATLTGYTTTGSQTLTVRYYSASTSAAPSTIVNPNASDDSRNIQQVSTVTVIEYL